MEVATVCQTTFDRRHFDVPCERLGCWPAVGLRHLKIRVGVETA